MHGAAKNRGTVVEENVMIGAGGRDVHVAHVFICGDTTAHSIKNMSAFISLSDLDPTQVHFQETYYDGDNCFRINSGRTDSALKIKQTVLLGDGEAINEDVSGDYLNFDSRESAERFGKALIHAVTLCGGKPAPF